MDAPIPAVDDAFARLVPDTAAAHAALKTARECLRQGNLTGALDRLEHPDNRDTPLAGLLRADLLLATGKVQAAEELALTLCRTQGDTAQGWLCAGHAALTRGDRSTAGERFARALAADPGRIAARINATALARTPTSSVTSDILPENVTPGVAVTSLPPRPDARHHAAIAGLTAAGFARILSVNTVREIESLRQGFPAVTFVPGPDTAAAHYGRPYAAINDLLAAGAATGASTVAIINADIVLTAPADFAGRLSRMAAGGAVFACRVDVNGATADQGVYYDVGFDLCAVQTGLLTRLDLEGFYLGLPWWDYALPLAVRRAGGQLRFAAQPILRHTVHPMAWSNRHFLTLGRHFVRRFFPEAAAVLFPAGESATTGEAETCLAGLGARTASFLRRATAATLGPQTAFCPHDPHYAAALLPLTRVSFAPPA